MNIRSKRLPRRTLLRAGSVTLALPFLEGMLPRSAKAQAAAPKRLIYWFKPNGVHPPSFFPKNPGEGYDLPRLLSPIGEVPGLQSHVSVLSNVGIMARVHEPHSSGTTAYLTTEEILESHGVHVRGPSIDQVAADHLRNSGVVTPIHSLVLGGEPPRPAGCGGNGSTGVYCSTLSWTGPTTPVPREHRPTEVFRQFTENLGGEPGQGATPNVWSHAEAQQSVLSYVNREAKQLELQLGTRDKEKLDEYLTSVSELEGKINATRSTVQCSALEPLAAAESYVEEHQQMIDLMVLAAKCDLTRVMSFMIGNGASSHQYRHLGLNSNWHPFSHHNGDPKKLEGYAIGSTYEIGLYATFLSRLMNETDVDGNSILHNSSVVLSTDVEAGTSHGRNKIATLVAGKGGGMLDTGKHVVYAGKEPMANVHTALIRTIGMDMNFGNSVTGPAAGLLL